MGSVPEAVKTTPSLPKQKWNLKVTKGQQIFCILAEDRKTMIVIMVIPGRD